jgi:hypothetical protein
MLCGMSLALPPTQNKTVTAMPFDAISITPLSAGPQEPNETIEGAVYTKDKDGNDKRVFFLDEVGILVTEDKQPIVNDGTLITTYNDENQNYIDGANKALNIFLDSHLERHYLYSGGKYTTSITLDREVFLINYQNKMIYSFRNERKKDWYEYIPIVNIFTSLREKYLWYDMNGRQLKTDDIGEYENAWIAKTTKVITAIATLGVSEYFWSASFTDIREKTTLAELTNLMTHATTHPWQGLTDASGDPVVTVDGARVRINPRTNQLTDDFGWALFNENSGLPIIFYNNDIITTDLQQQTVQNAVLLQAISVNGLLNTGTEFYMDSITTQFGTFDVPVFYNKNSNKWTLTNGQDTDGITNGIELWTQSPSNGQSFGDWWNENFGDLGDGINKFLQIGAIILGVIVLILLFPLIPPIIAVIAFPFKMLASALKKKSGGKNENN